MNTHFQNNDLKVASLTHRHYC